MKFNSGEWVLKPGVQRYNCEQIRGVTVAPDKTSVQLFAVKYRQEERSMDGPAMELTVSSPQPDILRLQAVHFKGGRRKMPAFALSDAACPLDVQETAEAVTVTSGETALRITKRPCSFTYTCRGQVIVGEKVYGLGERFTPWCERPDGRHLERRRRHLHRAGLQERSRSI
jgi:alpha-D-xyloside xylohydrolase